MLSAYSNGRNTLDLSPIRYTGGHDVQPWYYRPAPGYTFYIDPYPTYGGVGPTSGGLQRTGRTKARESRTILFRLKRNSVGMWEKG